MQITKNHLRQIPFFKVEQCKSSSFIPCHGFLLFRELPFAPTSQSNTDLFLRRYAEVVDDMLKGGSVNMYMFIGGTNFGFTSGANHYETYAPDFTSYDYDALLTECGDVTLKYMAVREVIAQHTGKALLPVPSDRPKVVYGKVYAATSAGLFDNLDNLSSPIQSQVPECMEYYNAGYGYIVYTSTLNRDYDNAGLSFAEVGDRAQVYVGNNHVGTVYINNPPYEVTFSAKRGDKLAVVCENMGRTNFGPKMMRKKVIVGRTLIDGKIHFGWQAYPLAMDNLDRLQWNEKRIRMAFFTNSPLTLPKNLATRSFVPTTSPRVSPCLTVLIWDVSGTSVRKKHCMFRVRCCAKAEAN